MKTKAIFSSFFGMLFMVQMCNAKDIKGSNADAVDSSGIKKIDNSSSTASPDVKNHIDKSSLVTTITGLRAISNPVTGIKYKTTDFGSGDWIYDPADKTSPDNSGTVIVAGSARYKRVFSGPIAAEWFGAKGNGIDDDTKAVQLAIANGTNKTVTMKAGATYVISGTLALPVGCNIEGNNSTIMNEIDNAKQLFHIVNSNCSISNFIIKNGIPNSNPNGDKLGAQLSSDIIIGDAHNLNWIDNTKIINVKIFGSINHTSAIGAGYGMVENVLIKDCVVDGSFLTGYHVEWNNPTKMAIRSPHNIQFINCSAINNSHPSGQSFYIAGAYNVTLENCTAQDVKGGIYLSNGDTGVEEGKIVAYSVKDCHVTRFSDYGITIIGSNLKNTTEWYIGATIDNCHIVGTKAGPGGPSAIRIYKNGGGISIINSTIEKCITGISATYSSGTGIKIDHNIFDNLYSQAIDFAHVTNSTISNNQFKDVNTKGHTSPFDVSVMLSYASNKNTISNNTFGYPGQTTLPYYHIHIVNLPSSGDLSVDNNIVNNTFNPTASKTMILNGDARAGSNQKTHQSGNRLLDGRLKLVTGAPLL